MMEKPVTAAQLPSPWRISYLRTFSLMVATFFAMFLLAFVYRIPNHIIEASIASKRVEIADAIGIALNQYARDHGGKYPDGKSSTDVFQQLIDQGYVTDPTLFYLPMAGKSKPQGKQLKSENVCWDVTNAVRPDDSDYLPIAFTTGYRIQYRLLGNAEPLSKAAMMYLVLVRKDGFSYMMSSQTNGVVKDAVISVFEAKGRNYQQLTPDGPLP